MNLWQRELLNAPPGLVAAALIGFLFGFWLERAGFGSSRRLTDIFYLRDFAVLRVMFTAIVTAAVGLWVFKRLGLIDPATIAIPESIVGAQAIGGLIFGVGFVMGGWCPGTAVVGLASGKLDAIFFLLGAGAGSLAFTAAEPSVQGLFQWGACGVVELPGLLGISRGMAVLGVVLMAVGAFAFVTKLERRTAAAKGA